MGGFINRVNFGEEEEEKKTVFQTEGPTCTVQSKYVVMKRNRNGPSREKRSVHTILYYYYDNNNDYY